MWPFKEPLFKERRSFITGSQAYGAAYRTSNSDIDIVLYLEEEAFDELKSFVSDEVWTTWEPPYGKPSAKGGRIKMGSLDLILVTSKKDYDRWKEVTKALKKENPLTKDQVVGIFKSAGNRYS